MTTKQQMVLNKISNVLPSEEKQFLMFMAESADNTVDYSEYSIEELIDGFIGFEEDNNEEELTPEIMDEVMEIYVDGFRTGVF